MNRALDKAGSSPQALASLNVEYTAGGRSPLGGWPGGKFYSAREIIRRIPAHQTYCEPFCGACWVLMKKSRSANECINDLNDDIYNFFEIVRTRADELMARAAYTLHARVQQRKFLEEALPAWEQDPIERAFRFYYLLACAMNPTRFREQSCPFRSGKSGKRFSSAYFIKIISIAHERLQRVNIEHLDWEKVVKLYDSPETFFYLDPPYPFVRQPYDLSWKLADYEKLALVLSTIRGKFLLSLNDRPECREIFKAFNIEARSVLWPSAFSGKQVPELFISNYEYANKKELIDE